MRVVAVEVRLPLALLGFSDPSTRMLFVQHVDGTVTTVETPQIGIAAHAGGELLRTSGHSWDPWNGVEWHERRKAGFETVAEAMDDLWQRQQDDG